MSGGIAYVYDPDQTFPAKVNYEMVDLDPLDEDDRSWLHARVRAHHAETDSVVASRVLDTWDEAIERFRKVMPRDYKRVLEAARIAEESGLDVDEAIMAAAHG
jgi:glutamate synthase (NADPH/NADH) large chain